MSNNNNPDLGQNNNFNIFNQNNNNYENLIGNSNINLPNQEHIQNLMRDVDGLESVVLTRNGTVHIPNQLGNVFDNVAVTLLGRGAASNESLTRQLRKYKQIHWGKPKEPGFFENALLAGGKVKFVTTAQTGNLECPFVRGQTELARLKEQCLVSDRIRPQVPWKIVQKIDLQQRVIEQVNWSIPFWVGLIQALDKEAFLKHLEDADQNSIKNKCTEKSRNVQSWYTAPDPLWHPEESSKTSKTSNKMANSLNKIDLIGKDPEFARMYFNCEVSGVGDQMRHLKSIQRRESVQFTTHDNNQYDRINNEVMCNIKNKEIDRFKLKDRLTKQMWNEADQYKLKLIEFMANMGDEDFTGWKFQGLENQHYKKLVEGIEKSLKMINTNTGSDLVAYVTKKILVEQLGNFFRNR